MVVTINGKVREKIEMDRDMDEEELKRTIFSLERVQKHLEGRAVRKTVVIPNKLINIVLG